MKRPAILILLGLVLAMLAGAGGGIGYWAAIAYFASGEVVLGAEGALGSGEIPAAGSIVPLENLNPALDDKTQPDNPTSVGYSIPILMYHQIGPSTSQLSVDEEDFALQMAYLAQEGYQTISLDEAVNLLAQGVTLPAKRIVLTFDDGYRDNYTRAWPLLKKHGFTATVFLIVDAVGNPENLSWDQVYEMMQGGVHFECHTRTHPDLRQVSSQGLHREIVEAKSLLEERLGQPINFFCYPAGKYDQRTLQVLQASGYRGGVTTAYGAARPGDNLLTLPRVRINRSDGLQGFINKLKQAEKDAPAETGKGKSSPGQRS